MAKVDKADYEGIAAKANQMRMIAQELNRELTNAYTSVQNMHNSWYGKRYNSLAKEFNEMVPHVNELLVLVVGNIPCDLETIANNYAGADSGARVVAATNTPPKKVSNLPMPNDVGLRFITSEVESVRASVSANFKNVVNKMETIWSTYTKMEWQSEASEAYTNEFSTIKKNIIEDFNNIENSFSKLMQQTLNDMQAAENANTVK